MLRKKIKIENDSVDNTDIKKIGLKKSIYSIVAKESPLVEDIKNNDSLNIGKWLVENVFSEEVINNLKKNLYISVPYTDKNSISSEWLNMFMKSYLSQEDIDKVTNTINKNVILTNQYKEYYENILIEKKSLEEKNKFLIENLDSEKNKFFKIMRSIDQMVKLSKFIEYNFKNVEDSEGIKILLIDTLNSDSDNLDEFIIPFSVHSQNILLLKKYVKNDLEFDIQLYLDEIKLLLEAISNQYVPQRKKLLEELATIISKRFPDIRFVSPEEYTFLDPNIHNIPSSGGQKVIEGISFAVVKNETNQTMIYADIVAE